MENYGASHGSSGFLQGVLDQSTSYATMQSTPMRFSGIDEPKGGTGNGHITRAILEFPTRRIKSGCTTPAFSPKQRENQKWLCSPYCLRVPKAKEESRVAVQPLPAQGPQSGENWKPLHNPCLLGVPTEGRHQNGYINPSRGEGGGVI